MLTSSIILVIVTFIQLLLPVHLDNSIDFENLPEITHLDFIYPIRPITPPTETERPTKAPTVTEIPIATPPLTEIPIVTPTVIEKRLTAPHCENHKKPIVIFGATGNVGLAAVKYVVKKGHIAKVFVRNITKLPEDLEEKVISIVADVRDPQEVFDAVSNTAGVVVALGTGRNLSATTVLSEGMKNIVVGMKKHNVSVVSVVITGFLFFEPSKVPPKFRVLTEDHRRMFEVLKESGLNWIAVFPPRIIMDESSSSYKIHQGGLVPGKGINGAINKNDLAEFLVTSLERPEFYQRVYGIANESTPGITEVISPGDDLKIHQEYTILE